VFVYIQDHIWKMIYDRISCMLSKAGKTIMLSYIAQPFLTYGIGVFLLPIIKIKKKKLKGLRKTL